jgi:hypothetical protein
MTVNAASLRQAILTSIPADPFQTRDPEPRLIYVPRTHIRALDPDNMLVVGARGTGKSFWWHTLLSDVARAALTPQAPSMQRGELKVSAGWSEQASLDFPDKDVLAALCKAGLEARLIWKTVLLYQVSAKPPSLQKWQQRVEWVIANPEEVAQRIIASDTELAANNARHLVLFDALDRTANAWKDRRALLKGLLQLVLELRSTRAIRAKVFVRPDMIDDPETLAFVDASKVAASRVDLTWPRLELYGLLWQHMGNAEQGAGEFRSLVAGWKSEHEIFRLPEPLRTDDAVQRKVFASIAGRAMGTDERRGLPYTWIPTHLGDASAVATPRSFLAALRKAAEDTGNNAARALDWRAIHGGVRRASEIRVTELAEDFPWAKPAMQALEGLNVPCKKAELVGRWEQNNVMRSIEKEPEGRVNKGARRGVQGLLDDLVDISVLEVRPDSRFNIPDVYRVGFGLKRRGGVRPVV